MEVRKIWRVELFLLLIIFGICHAALGQPLISTNFYQTDLREALRIVSHQSGINILSNKDVVGVVTLELKKTPLEEALTKMLIPWGYTFEKKDSYYLVAPADVSLPVFELLSSTRVIKLSYVNVQAIARTLPSQFSHYLKMDKERNILVVTAPTEIIDRIQAYVRLMDQPNSYVGVEIIVAEILREKGRQLDIDWSWEWVEKKEESEGVSVDGLAVGYTSEEILATLIALGQTKQAKILASVRTMSLEREEILINEEIERYYEFATELEKREYRRLETITTGFTLRIRPIILSPEETLIELELGVDDIENMVDGLPKIVRRTAKTVLSGKTGKTMVLGGLTERAQCKAREHVVGLGKIPVAHILFAADNSFQNEKELIILVTPRLPGKASESPDTALMVCNWNNWGEIEETHQKEHNHKTPLANFSLELSGLFGESQDEKGYYLALSYLPGSDGHITGEYSIFEGATQRQATVGVVFKNALPEIAEDFFLSFAYQNRKGEMANTGEWQDYQSNLYLVSLMQVSQIRPQLNLTGRINLSYVQEEGLLSDPIYGWEAGLIYYLTSGLSLKGKYQSFFSEEDKYKQCGYIVQLVSHPQHTPWNVTIGYQWTDEQQMKNLLGMFAPAPAYYLSLGWHF